MLGSVFRAVPPRPPVHSVHLGAVVREQVLKIGHVPIHPVVDLVVGGFLKDGSPPSAGVVVKHYQNGAVVTICSIKTPI